MAIKHSVWSLIALGTIAGATLAVTSASAFAASQPTYAQAWARCKKLLDDQNTPGTLTSNDRYYRGSACMKKYGYSI